MIRDLILHQKKAGHNVDLITSDTEYAGYCNYPEFLDSFNTHDIHFHKMDSLFKRDETLNAKVVEKITELASKKSIDVIHSHSATPSKIALDATLLMQKTIPIIQTMQGWGQNKTPEQEKADIQVMKRVDMIVPVSNSSRHLLEEKGLERDLMQTIYNGIGKPNLNRISEEDHSLVSNLKRSPNTKNIIGCIGSICVRKNQAILIEAMYKALQAGNNIHCLFIGEGDERKKLKSRVDQLGIAENISFLGYRPSADAYIRYLDLLILPSLAEGLPLTILEGFREKTIVVGSDIPEITEIISNAKTGFLFKSNDAQSLSKTITYALNSEDTYKQTIKETAFEAYQHNFTLEKIAEQYELAYLSLRS